MICVVTESEGVQPTLPIPRVEVLTRYRFVFRVSLEMFTWSKTVPNNSDRSAGVKKSVGFGGQERNEIGELGHWDVVLFPVSFSYRSR